MIATVPPDRVSASAWLTLAALPQATMQAPDTVFQGPDLLDDATSP